MPINLLQDFDSLRGFLKHKQMGYQIYVNSLAALKKDLIGVLLMMKRPSGLGFKLFAPQVWNDRKSVEG